MAFLFSSQVRIAGVVLLALVTLWACRSSSDLPPIPAPSPTPPPQTLGKLAINYPTKVVAGQPFVFFVWLQPRDANFSGKVKVFTENTAALQYEFEEFELEPNMRQKVTATIRTAESGLARLHCYAHGWDPIDQTIDTGFSAKLKTNLGEAIESRTVKSLALSFVDRDGNPIKLDAPATLWLRGSKVKFLSLNPVGWTDVVAFQLGPGSSKLAVDIKPTTFSADTGLITAVLNTPQGALYDDNIYVSIAPPWYAPLTMAILGGLLYSAAQFLRRLASKRKPMLRSVLLSGILSLVAGALAGVVAYLLATWNVLGIRIDPNSLKGFVVLGFLFSYLGIDAVMRLVTTKKGRE